jgi:N-sulfoglucosamine sulfohydrolase
MQGQLEGPQTLLFQEKRPVEELYDTLSDPFEIDNLAANPLYAHDLERMRRALDDWLAAVGDLGREPEAEMVRRWYPGGVQPKTAAPLFIAVCDQNPGIEATQGGDYHAPLLIQVHCATQGASIAYTFDDGPDARWQLYTGPLSMPLGESVLRARAVRIGYKESVEQRGRFSVVA